MKFIVKGKSVDFRSREGSSPSIPNKKPILLPNYFIFYILYYPIFFVIGSNKIHYVSHSFYSFTNGYEQQFLYLIPSLWTRYDTRTNGHIWARIPIIKSFTVHIIILTKESLFFFFLKI